MPTKYAALKTAVGATHGSTFKPAKRFSFRAAECSTQRSTDHVAHVGTICATKRTTNNAAYIKAQPTALCPAFASTLLTAIKPPLDSALESTQCATDCRPKYAAICTTNDSTLKPPVEAAHGSAVNTAQRFSFSTAFY